MGSIKSRLGKCYQLAGRYAIDHPEAILVHGTINGLSHTGIDFDNPHAWIQDDDEIFDPVQDIRLPKEVYFRFMNAKEIKRYSYKETQEMLLKFKNWGSWPIKQATEKISVSVSNG